VQNPFESVDEAFNFSLKQSFSNWGPRPTQGSWTIFGGVASWYFIYTTVLHLLYSSFRWGSLVYTGLL